MEVRVMARDVEWAIFEKAVEVTASALRGTMGLESSREAAYAGEVFKEIYAALKEAAAAMPEQAKAGF
jgi:hypothetical protein